MLVVGINPWSLWGLRHAFTKDALNVDLSPLQVKLSSSGLNGDGTFKYDKASKTFQSGANQTITLGLKPAAGETYAVHDPYCTLPTCRAPLWRTSTTHFRPR